MWVGPATSEVCSWLALWGKYQSWVPALASFAAPASLAAINYVSRALPTMSYTAQFQPLPFMFSFVFFGYLVAL
eukprot:6857959-Pyramimonas_sp.AAC.1